MKVFRQLQELCIALIVIHTGAEITLNVVTPLDTLPINGTGVEVDFECGSRVIFVCEIKPYIDTADWQVNSKTYALCLLQNCFFYPPYPADHNLSMSLATETFNLTTDPITLAAERNIYSCSNGLTPLSVDANVKVYVKNETLEMDTSTASQITLTTGCVYPYGKDNMTFEWFISKDRVLLQKSQFVRDEVQSIIAFACAETSDCAGAESVQFNSTMVVDIFDTGDDYHICVAVQHIGEQNRPPAVHCSVQTYRVSSYITDGSARTLSNWKILTIIPSISRLFFVQKCFFVLFEVDKSNLRVYLIGVFLPGLGLILQIRKQDKITENDVFFNKTIKMSYSISCVIVALDIIVIVAIIVLALTQLELTQRIYIPVAICYILFSWVASTIIVFACIYASIRCTHCYTKSDLTCKVCKKHYCKDCVRQDRCLKDRPLTCGTCNNARNEMKMYCCKCKKFLCNSCSKNHVKCKGILLKHPQHDTDREEEIFCENKHDTHTRDSACGYCLECDCYLCLTCLRSHANHQLLLIQRYFDAVKDRLCCSRVHTDHTGSYPGLCLKCKLYICLKCSEQHRGDEHHLIMHKDSFLYRKSCANHAGKLAECYSYTECVYLCSDCFEQGHTAKQICRYRDVEMENLRNKCCLDEHFDEKCFNTESYCLICKMCLCMRCYKLHRNFTKHWIKTHDRNTYFCKKCQKEGKLFPVECVDLDYFTISCAECFDGKDIAERETSEDYNKLNELQRQLSKWNKEVNENLCQIHEIAFSDQTDKVRSNVYCLICKAYMCNICYKQHRRLGSLWLENEKRKYWKRSSLFGFERTALGPKLIICTLLPVVGIVVIIVLLCRQHKDSHRVEADGMK